MLSRRRWFDCSIHQLLQLFSHSVRGGQTMKPFFKESPKKVAQEGHLLAPPLRNCTATIAASPRIVDRGYLIIHFMFRLFSFLHWKFYQCLRTHERTFDHVVRGDQCTSPSPCVYPCRRSRYPSKQKEMFASPFSFCHSIQITFNDTADRLPLFSPVRLENKATWERREGKKTRQRRTSMICRGKDVSMLNASSRLVVPIPRTLARVCCLPHFNLAAAGIIGTIIVLWWW